jgi:cell wall-associated NlpC family hydrolase
MVGIVTDVDLARMRRGTQSRQNVCRALRLPRYWSAGALAALLASVVPMVTAGGAGADQMSTLQAKANQIEQEITTDTQQIGILGQRYDLAMSEVQQLQGEIAATKSQIASDQRRVSIDKAHLRQVAIDSYISEGTIGQVNPLFAGNQRTYTERLEYGKVATGNLDVVVATLHSAEAALSSAESNLVSQQSQAQAEANAATQARLAAQNQQTQLDAALSQVKGQIGALVAQEQAAAAAAEAARTQAVLAAARSSQSAPSQGSAPISGGSSPQGSVPPPPPSGGAATAVAAAESQLGVPYVWGGTDPRGTPGDPSGGFDCSGLVMWAWAQAGVDLPHYSGAQFEDTTPVPVADMEPGDILFYGPGGDEHEAMYVGNGEMIEAPYTGAVVHITPIRLGDGFAGVHRV